MTFISVRVTWEVKKIGVDKKSALAALPVCLLGRFENVLELDQGWQALNFQYYYLNLPRTMAGRNIAPACCSRSLQRPTRAPMPVYTCPRSYSDPHTPFAPPACQWIYDVITRHPTRLLLPTVSQRTG